MTTRHLGPTTRPVPGPLTTAPRPRSTRVRVTGSCDVTAAGLRALLAPCAELELVGPEFESAELLPGDVDVVDASGLLRAQDPVVQALRPARAGLSVVAIVPGDRPDLARRALDHGARGILVLQWPAADVVSTVLAATRGRFVRPEALTRTWARTREGRQSASLSGLDLAHGGDLTPRELQVLGWVAAGASNGEIADHLFVSVNTIKTYIRSTYRRIGVTTRSQAMLWCFEHGLVELPAAGCVAALRLDQDASAQHERRLG